VTSSTSANEVVETLVYSVLLRAWMQNVEGSDVKGREYSIVRYLDIAGMTCAEITSSFSCFLDV
jgi:hypothetical protein